MEIDMAAQEIKLITDSTCDIPGDLIQPCGIIVIPQIVAWDAETLRVGFM
jgi:fatty acid-binding protein DegV